MALNKQIVEFPLDFGLDTKTDSKKLDFGSLSVAENIVYETLKSFKKRNGYDRILNVDVDGNEVTGVEKLAAFKKELVGLTNGNLYAFSECYNAWVERGKLYSAVANTKPIVQVSNAMLNPVMEYAECFKVYLYESDQGGIYYTVVDDTSGSSIVYNSLFAANGTNPKICKIGNIIYGFYADSADIKYKTFNILNPNNLSSEQVFVDDFDSTDNSYDLQSSANSIIIAYQSTGDLQARSLDADGNLSSTLSFAGESCSNGVCVVKDIVGRLVVGFSSTTEVKYLVLPASFSTTLLGPTLLETVSNAGNITLADNGVDYEFFYTINNADPSKNSVRKNTADLAGNVGTASLLSRSVSLASTAFNINSQTFIPCLHESDLQTTYFLLSNDGTVASKFLQDVGGIEKIGGGLSLSVLKQDGQIEICAQQRQGIAVDASVFYSVLGISSTALDFNFSSKYENEDLANNKHIAGGILSMYDGSNVVEHGFHLYPEELEEESTDTVGGFLTDGTYGYQAIYSWTDNQGNVHRSAQSLNLSVTLSGGGSTQTATIRVPTLRLTNKENVTIELYRTEVNTSEVYYRVTSITSPVLNDKTVDFVDIEDGLADASLISNLPLYTTGGIVENIAPPTARYIANYRNRIVLSGLENDNSILFSKLALQGSPVEFSDLFVIKLSDKGGPITGTAELDNKLVVFKETSVYIITGQGPNNLGEQDDFSAPELVSSDIGCIDAKSIVLTPKGLMFKSLKGIYLLTSGLQLVYVGDRVEAFNNFTITDVDVKGNLNQVRFLTDDKIALVYNYELNKWATFTNHAGVSSATILNDYYYLRADGTLFKENPNKYSDDGTPIKLRIVTGWMYLNIIQGFQRVYKAFILGSYRSPHKIRTKLSYDFVDAYTQEAIIDIGNFINTNNYGEDSPYGVSDPNNYGGTDFSGNRYQMRIDLQKQKCQAVKMSIEDIQGDVIGEGLSISGITFQIGGKKGAFKISGNRQFGTNS